MTIQEIIEFYGGTYTSAGKMLGVTRQRVGQVADGTLPPPKAWQLKVEGASRGKLKADVCKRCGQPT